MDAPETQTIPASVRDHLVVYKNWKLGKDMVIDDPTLDLSPYSYLEPRVVKYATVFETPTALNHADIEIPTAYLSKDFNRFFFIDATNPDLEAGREEIVAPLNTSAWRYLLAGGSVLATQALDYALGVYSYQQGPDYPANPLTVYFTLWDFISAGNTTKLSAAYVGSIPAGGATFTSYVITGTFTDVEVAMHHLYAKGYH